MFVDVWASEVVVVEVEVEVEVTVGISFGPEMLLWLVVVLSAVGGDEVVPGEPLSVLLVMTLGGVDAAGRC